MKKKRASSEGPRADVRDALVEKIKEVETGMKQWRELFVSLLEIYPADSENVFTGGKYAAITLVKEAISIAEIVHHLDPGKKNQETVLSLPEGIDCQEPCHE